MSNTPPISFSSYSFNGLIFKILPDNKLPLLGLEIRHTEHKEVSFAVIDYHQNKILFEGLGLEEDWWVGLVGFHDGTLFFHKFAGKEYPQPLSLIAADVFAQSLIWEREGIYLEGFEENNIVVSSTTTQYQTWELLDIKGNTVRHLDSIEQANLSHANHLLFPSQYTEGTNHFVTIAHFLKYKFGLNPQFYIDYLEFGQYILMSYRLNDNDYLLILNNKGEKLHEELLNSSTILPIEGSFFVVKDYLITTKQKSTLLFLYLGQ
jgi:hypothetical protein